MRRQIDGMVVVITGASAGIGLALARQLSSRGARLVLAARRLERLQQANLEMRDAHLVVQADVGRSEDCRRIVEEAMGRFGQIDTLVCNAGYGSYMRVDETGPEEVRHMMEVDVLGTTECIRHALPHMTKQALREGWRGQIMIVSSAAARRGTPFIGIYSGAKAAQLAIAEALRVELRDSRVAVTTVHPTPTRSEFKDVAEKTGKYRLPPSDRFIKTQTSEQVAAAMLRAIQRPRAEVWPRPIARAALSALTFAPSLADAAMYRYFDAVMRFNGLR